MQAEFVKMEGLGNDFVVFDERAASLGIDQRRAASICDRHRGVGCDQLISIEAVGDGADAFMRIRNPDGSEAGACGNATRCVAWLLFEQTGRRRQVIRTIAGVLPAEVRADGTVEVDMGPAGLDWRDVPLARAMDTLHLDLEEGPLMDPAACSMGNPHATFFLDFLDNLDIPAVGPVLEHDPLFPERANIGFVQILAKDRLRLRMWERGAGMTLACGSGACAALVNAHRRGLAERRGIVVADGGELEITWRDDGHVLMAGPVARVFSGTITL
jgi:diaminopimelate epimerase